MAFLLEADISVILRKGALEAPGGQLDFARNIRTLNPAKSELAATV